MEVYQLMKETKQVEQVTRSQVRNEVSFLLSKLEDENLNRDTRLQYASDDLFNWINSVIAQAQQKAVERERAKICDLIKDSFNKKLVTASNGNIYIEKKLRELILVSNQKKYYSMQQILEALQKEQN